MMITMTRDYQKELNQEQYKVVTSGDGACLVLAGAGSGKTRTLVYRAAYLLDQGVDPSEIMLVTFTNKAAKEMLERINQLIGRPLDGLWGGTFHHIGNRFLRKYGGAIGLGSNFNIMDSDDSLALVKWCAKEIGCNDDRMPKPAVIHGVISYSANTMRPLTDVMMERYDYLPENVHYDINRIAQRYQERKKELNLFDYDDLLTKWLELVRDVPAVRTKIHDQFKYLMVDEYQDTNYVQSSLIRNLVRPGGNVLVVGDDAQSIYGFRGADVQNILDFPKTFGGCQVFKLESNYRSTPQILTLANTAISYNTNQFAKALVPMRGAGDQPQIFEADDGYDQARFVIDMIRDQARRNGHKLRDCAVLFRSHYQALELELELNRRGIAYVLRGGMRFFEQAHIKDLVSYLKLIANHHDELAWLRVLMLYQGIGEATARKLIGQLISSPTLAEALQREYKLTPKAQTAWQQLKTGLVSIIGQGIDQTKVSDLLKQILDQLYQRQLKTLYERYEDRLDDLEQFADFTAKFNSIDELLTEVALSEKFKTDKGHDTDHLVLSTIHQAKGLEWPIVFVIGLNQGQFPHLTGRDQGGRLEEERRLFYVAVTRARERLYLSWVKVVRDGVGTPSTFLTEVENGDGERRVMDDEVVYDYRDF